MESSSTSTRFLFRDHQEVGDYTQSDASSDTSTVSGDGSAETELDSMTGKGIKHLCSELLELKVESDEDFHRTMFSNYDAFVRIFEEVRGVEHELMQLRSQLATQKRLVKDLANGTHVTILTEEVMESIIQESGTAEISFPRELELHLNDVSDTIDVLLLENRVDEAIGILEQQDENLQLIDDEDDSLSDLLVPYNNMISERKTMIILQLTAVAENPRTPAPELQKALARLFRLGDSQLATQLLLKYYHLRISTGTHKLQSTKLISRRIYVQQLAKFVFSMISQAAKSFVMLHGDASSHASELIQWASEEIEIFSAIFNRYVKAATEVSIGLANAVEAMRFATSYCSLIEKQKLVLMPCLIKFLRPCMEEVLQIHIDHFRKVIAIFTASDGWVLGRYLIPGILNEKSSSMVIGQQPIYYLLTNSGRKFMTLLQTVTEDITPLLAIQMESSILRGLMDLFIAYKSVLEKAMTFGGHLSEKGPAICVAESLEQQVSLLANVSTLKKLWSNIIARLFKSIKLINSDATKRRSIDLQPNEVKDCKRLLKKATAQLRAHFCTHYINRMRSSEVGNRVMEEVGFGNEDERSKPSNRLPSVPLQVLFCELRNLDEHVEDGIFDLDWLMKLLRELVEAIFKWISNGGQIQETAADSSSVLNSSDNFEQIILDVHFLMEVTRRGGYFFEKPMVLEALVESTLTSIGLDPKSDSYSDEWAKMAAIQAMQKLQEMERAKSEMSNESVERLLEVQSDNESDAQDESRSNKHEFLSSEDDETPKDAVDISMTPEKANETELIPEEPYSDMAHHSAAADEAPAETNCNKQEDGATDEAYDDLHDIELFNSSNPCLDDVNAGGTPILLNYLEDLVSSEDDDMSMNQKVANEDRNAGSSETEIASPENFNSGNIKEPTVENHSKNRIFR